MKPLRKRKAQKGTVAVICHNKMLRLRWRHEGKRYILCVGLPDSPLNRHAAREKAIEIEKDIAYGNFDIALDKYRQQSHKPAETPQLSTAQLFEQFTESRRARGSGEYNLTQVYGTISRYLQRFEHDIASSDRALEFIGKLKMGELRATTPKAISDRTLNKYLSLLRRFSEWAVAHDYWDMDPFRKCEPIRTERNRASRAVFSDEERDRILANFRGHRYYCHYHGFVAALFFLGFRPSELIGLQWKHLDLEARTITICESLSRGPDGRSAGYARQRKGTKTGTIRTLPLNDSHFQLLTNQRLSGNQATDLVFPSPKGRAIDDHNFSQRVWRSMLSATDITPYRPPYALRHTFATWGKRNGMTDEQIAYWLGHKTTRMVREHYGHLDEQPFVPEFEISTNDESYEA